MNRQNRGNRPNRNKKHPQNQPQKNGSSGAQVARKGSNQIDLEDLDFEEEFLKVMSNSIRLQPKNVAS